MAEWEPWAELDLDTQALRRTLSQAIAANSAWLRHPFVNPLTYHNPVNRMRRDLQLAVWTAANCDAELGAVTIPDTLDLWAPGGEETLSAGRVPLAALGQSCRGSKSPVPLALDPWCGSIGYPLEDSWALVCESAERPERTAEIVEFCRTIALVERLMPDVMQWILAATQVVIPMVPKSASVVRSGSQADLPALVYTDLHKGRLQIFETIIHETAHHHLYVAEAEGPLVDPDHTNRYHSPLRPERRPLRGILLACHALAYICAGLADAARSRFASHEACTDTLRDLETRRGEAEEVLRTQRDHLTSLGREFFDRTREVCKYGKIAR